MDKPAAWTATINELLEEWVCRQPNRRLFAFLDGRGDIIEDFSYDEFSRRVDTLTSELIKMDWLKVGDRIILSYQPGIEIIAAFFACSKAGLVAIPAPPLDRLGQSVWLERLSHIIKNGTPSAWLTCSHTLDLLEEVRHLKCEEWRSEDTIGWLAAHHLCTSTIKCSPAGKVIARRYAIALQQYTSGSTSDPKGILIGHDNLISNCRAVVDHDQPVAVTWLPQHHDMGLIGYYIYIALSGGTTFGLSPRSFIRNPKIWLEVMSRHNATATSVPNFALEVCLNERRVPISTLERYDLSALRFLMVAAEPVSPSTFEAFLNRFSRCGLKRDAFFVAYGLAEYTLAVTSYGRKSLSVDLRQLSQRKVSPIRTTSAVAHAMPLMSCGRPLGDNCVRIVDAETGVEVPSGHTGEIWVTGSGIGAGYWKQPEQTRASFEARIVNAADAQRDFLRTGDIGFIQDDELYVCGRLKDMIIVRGKNIYPEDVEFLVRQSNKRLRGNAVVAFRSFAGDPSDITLVAEVTRAQAMPDEAQIARLVRERLQVPATRVVLVEPQSIPKTSSGKVRRSRTRELLESGQLRIISDSCHSLSAKAPLNAFENQEIELLKERYGLTGDEDFTLMDAGIDSLDLVVFLGWIKDNLIERNAPELAARVNPKLVAGITIRDLFSIAARFQHNSDFPIADLTKFLSESVEARVADEQLKMQSDRSYKTNDCCFEERPESSGGVFLTGGTGFLGPFLISSLLSQSDDSIHVLVRGNDEVQAWQRLHAAFAKNVPDPDQLTLFEKRVHVVLGDLEAPRLGLTSESLQWLSESIETIYHNGALVNYLLEYDAMRDANVVGTERIIDLCLMGRRKTLNYISTTFIFGWATTDLLAESSRNESMEKLDFGYSQSKWVAEQKVFSAIGRGLSARVFRPALITPGLGGGGGNLDIALRLLSFMIKHRLGVTAGNQVSFMPADITATNIVALSGNPETLGHTFHVVRDDHETMSMITDIIEKRTNTSFELFDLPEFVQEVIRRCTRSDPLYPLLDFLVDSIDNISAMEFKRYTSTGYQTARDNSLNSLKDPPLESVVDGILSFLDRGSAI